MSVKRLSLLAPLPAGVLAALAVAFAVLLGGNTVQADSHNQVDVGTPTDRFTPAVVTIAAGESVTWTWSAGVHSVTAVDSSYDSGVQSTVGHQFSQTFSTPGEYFYYCVVHASPSEANDDGIAAGAMVGKVVVEEGTATETPTQTATETPTGTVTETPTETPTVPAGQWAMTVQDQTIPAGTRVVTIASVKLPVPGYVVIHEAAAHDPEHGFTGTTLGNTALLPAGTHTNVKITLTVDPSDGQILWPMAHSENTGNTTYDGANVDLPGIDSTGGNPNFGGVVVFPMEISLSAATGTATATATATPKAPTSGTGSFIDTNDGGSNAALYLLVTGGVLITAAGGVIYARRRV